jgi:hypothetical protein
VKSKVEARPPRPIRDQVRPARPSSGAFLQLAAASRRVRSRDTQIRRTFINGEFRSTAPPLSLIVRGGRAGGLRLRLMLAILWLAGGGDERHEATFPARAWAELLDLSDPGDAGQRRIRDALSWLEDEGLISIDREPGRPLSVTLRREDASGKPYISPLRAPKNAKTGKLPQRHWSVLLPSAFWTNGWALALSTPALAILLIMLEMDRSDGKPAWITPERARARYRVSEDTWTRGTRELEAHGLVRVTRQPVDTSLGWTRTRNNYKLRLRRLNTEPVWAD